MKKRYQKFVLEAEKGITFEVSEGTSGELIIRAVRKEDAKDKKPAEVSQRTDTLNGPKSEVEVVADDNKEEEVSQKSDSINYQNPPIPEGYKHILGEWNNGFVIERCSDGSQFVWIPVGSLDSNGTLDGEHFSEKFGRRTYMNYEFSDEEFNEALSDELIKQIESVKKYGGFYISRYNISRNYYGKPQSVKDVMPWRNINFYDAKKIAATIEDNEAVKSHLTFGAEYDSVLEWFIKTEVKTLAEIAEDSTEWGNHWNIENSPRDLVETGNREKWCANNIYDFAGNVDEWTQEQNGSSGRVIRGGNFYNNGNIFPVASRIHFLPTFNYWFTGFRATLYIK